MLERRGFLRSAAATALAAVPALPAGGSDIASSGSEVELEALYGSFLASVAAAEAASDRSWAISESVRYPEPPAAIYVQPGDDDLHLSSYAGPTGSKGRRRYGDCAALQWFAGCVNDRAHTEQQRAAWVRAAEIVQGLEEHNKAREAARDAVGADVAEGVASDAWLDARRMAQALAAAQATTLRGVLLKAKAIATQERGAEGLAAWQGDTVDNCRDPSTALAVGLTLDLIRLSGCSTERSDA